jgi:uncharacterized protein (TIGR00730 family)
MSKPKSLCVYCGSRAGSKPAFAAAAEKLGRTLAGAGVGLIYGGGGVGLMGVIGRTVIEQGGKAVGIVPGFLRKLEMQQEGLTELIVTETMHERKFLMYDMADAFAVLPGGIGTLEELTELLSWRHLRVHEKPIVIINIDHYWDPLLDLFEHAMSEDFAGPGLRREFTVVSRIEDVLPAAGLVLPATNTQGGGYPAAAAMPAIRS